VLRDPINSPTGFLVSRRITITSASVPDAAAHENGERARQRCDARVLAIAKAYKRFVRRGDPC
jgi:hypothetical protein